MKRFYKIAEAGTAPGGHVVRLDGKTIKTPLQHPLTVPTHALAAAMAEEWEAQKNDIAPASMPMNQLANTMIDKGRGHERREMEESLIDYGASDLLCYFAQSPQDLVARQKKHWQPLIDWMKSEFGITLETVAGIQYHHQPPESLNKIAVLIEKLDAAAFTVTQAAGAVTGSVIIALALTRGRINADAAYQAACVDEIFQLEKWGADELAQKRLDGIKKELEAVERFRELATQI
jgi:chaperone required for assembly of F1-ATPase